LAQEHLFNQPYSTNIHLVINLAPVMAAKINIHFTKYSTST